MVILLSSQFFLTVVSTSSILPALPQPLPDMVVSYGILSATKAYIQKPREYILSTLYFKFKGHNLAYADFIRWQGLGSRHLVPQFHPKFNVLPQGSEHKAQTHPQSSVFLFLHTIPLALLVSDLENGQSFFAFLDSAVG